MKYKGDITDIANNVKRLYVDGLILERECPECGKMVERDFGQDYISYGLDSVDFYCWDGCDNEWSIPATLKATVVIKTDE